MSITVISLQSFSSNSIVQVHLLIGDHNSAGIQLALHNGIYTAYQHGITYTHCLSHVLQQSVIIHYKMLPCIIHTTLVCFESDFKLVAIFDKFPEHVRQTKAKPQYIHIENK